MKKYFIILFILLICSTSHSQVSIITHPDNKTEKISKERLLDYYTGDIRVWEDGTPVIVYDYEMNITVRKIFFEMLGKSASRMKSIWMKRLLMGEGDPPTALKSEEEMIKKILKNKGAIGYVPSSYKNNSVKTLILID